MRSRKTMPFLMLVFVVSTTPFIGATEQAEPEPVAPAAAAVPAEVERTDPAPAIEPEAAVAPGVTSAPDPFLDDSEITTITPANTVFCHCLLGVNCCGDPGVGVFCGNRPLCVCNAQNECVVLEIVIDPPGATSE